FGLLTASHCEGSEKVRFCTLPLRPLSSLSEQIPLQSIQFCFPVAFLCTLHSTNGCGHQLLPCVAVPSRPSSLSQQGTVIRLSDACTRREQVSETLAQL